eukprot:3904965-Ditylum_brightwellii.AAC.1
MSKQKIAHTKHKFPPQMQQQQSNRPVANILQAVIDSDAPARSVSMLLGKTFIGHTTDEFDQNICLKQQLLIELSEAKATLGVNKETKICLEERIEEIQRENAKKAQIELNQFA